MDPSDGSFYWISCGSIGEVWGISMKNDLFRRIGITPANPIGSKWVKIEGKFINFGVYNGHVWAITKLYKIFNKHFEEENVEATIEHLKFGPKNGTTREVEDEEAKINQVKLDPNGNIPLEF